uniref:Chitinase n=1 Tax=Panagrolaimus sp. PS1159 TaxID=55785 RepID=A0AC35GJY4_9BILA
MTQKLLFVVFLIIFCEVSSEYIRGCYFTNWARYRSGIGKYEPEDYAPGLCTHIFFAFAKVKEDFTVDAFDPEDLPSGAQVGNYARINALKEKQPGLKVIVSVGGWSAGTAIFKQMASNDGNRKKFAQSAADFINKYNFDGIDVDWEHPDAGDKDNFVAMLKDLKDALKGKLVTIATTAASEKIDSSFNVPEVAKNIDFMNVMTYDFHGAWESKTGQNSPLYVPQGDTSKFSVSDAMNHWAKKGMPKEKLIVGIALYGRGWALDDPSNTGIGSPGKAAPQREFTREDGIASYYEICQLGGTRKWDDVQKVPYMVKDNLWFGYDDSDSIKEKINWLKQNGFGGAFVWTLDFDDFKGVCPGGTKYPLLNTIKNELGGGSSPPSNRNTDKPVTPPTPKPDDTPTNNNQYTVKAGDSCWSIATGHGLTLEQLKDKNPGLNCDPLWVGVKLNL